MSETTKTLLIVGGIALAGFLAYKYVTGKSVARNASGTTATPTNSTTSASTGLSGWLSAIGGVVSGLGSTANSVENSYNNLTSGGA